MARRTLSVTHNGQTFTRSTERIYTHVILVRSDYQRERDSAISWAIQSARDNYPFYVKEANPATREYNHFDMARIAAIAALTIDQYVQQTSDAAAAKIDARRDDGDYDRFGVLEWCGRNDLAHNAHGKAMKHGFAEVVIVEVPPAA